MEEVRLVHASWDHPVGRYDELHQGQAVCTAHLHTTCVESVNIACLKHFVDANEKDVHETAPIIGMVTMMVCRRRPVGDSFG